MNKEKSVEGLVVFSASKNLNQNKFSISFPFGSIMILIRITGIKKMRSANTTNGVCESFSKSVTLDEGTNNVKIIRSMTAKNPK